MKKIAILTGGSSSEREVSLNSAENVRTVLVDACEAECFDLPSEMEGFMLEHGKFDVAIPMIHGRGGEDGALQGFLQTLGVPYVFSGVTAHAVGLDKMLTKTVVAAVGIRTPKAVVVERPSLADFERPVVVKPIDGGSSVGACIVKAAAGLQPAVMEALKFSSKALIEDFIAGDEYTVAVADIDGQTIALPVIAIKTGGAMFDYSSKYDPAALAEEICPAPISPELAEELKTIALSAHRAIGCRHLSRTDIMVDEQGRSWFIEINTVPGMTKTSLVPKALAAAGIPFRDALMGWIEDAATK